MSASEWSIVAGVLTSVALAVGPWMFKVHAKLAEIATRLDAVCENFERARADERSLQRAAAEHRSRLDTLDVQFSHIAARLAKE